jgi:DNA polymerase
MFIGEAPGAHEDAQGIPFVGRAGELLTRIIEGGMKMTRDEIYIANIIKCRPPRNRDPLPEEVAICRPFILKQIEIVQPKVIVTLGRVAMQALLGNTDSITRTRGQWRELNGYPVMPTFHPAYLLRNPDGKKDVWQDIKTVLARLKELE